MKLDYFLSKKKKVTTRVAKELHQFFDSGVNRGESFFYRKITYLFDDGKNWVWTNHPKDYAGCLLMGIFAFKHYNGDW